ncbi:MAG: hypothetical protein H0T76_00330 [Nannocystis sp.]|nr:hypothetical protein [Nannocystis sp.]MBA3544906.1 hypothetical protein [Nannocystis sp.]
MNGPYVAYGLPATDAAWSVADYMRVRDALVKIEREQPELLPQAEGAGAALLERWSSLESIVAASKSASGVEALLDLGDAASEVFKLYAGRIAHGGASATSRSTALAEKKASATMAAPGGSCAWSTSVTDCA